MVLNLCRYIYNLYTLKVEEVGIYYLILYKL